MSPAVHLSGITKRFGAVVANDSIDLDVAKGSIHGIIGENGAGKSTVVSILYGFYTADSGAIEIDGSAARIASPFDAIAHGIGMVHQHFMLVPTFTVLENVMLGAEGGALLKGGAAEARAELLRLEEDYGLEVDPDALVGDLPVGLQQRVEILKALRRGARHEGQRQHDQENAAHHASSSLGGTVSCFGASSAPGLPGGSNSSPLNMLPR